MVGFQIKKITEATYKKSEKKKKKKIDLNTSHLHIQIPFKIQLPLRKKEGGLWRMAQWYCPFSFVY